MKKVLALGAVLLMHHLVFSQNYSGDTWAQVKAKGSGTISLAYVETFGFVYQDNGKLTGVCVGIMNDFINYINETKKVKLTSTFVGDGTSFKGMYDKVKASKGGVFGLGNITITDERKREVKFSEPYITNLAFLVSAKEVSTLHRMEDLPVFFGKLTAYTAKGTLNEKRINDIKQKYFPEMKIELTSTSQKTLEKVTSVPDGFAYLDLAFYLEAVQQHKQLKRHSVGDVASEKFGFVMPMSSDWQPLFEEFFKANGGYINSASYKNILRQHLGEIGLKLLQNAVK